MPATKDLTYYRQLPYTRKVTLREESDGRVIYVAHVEEIPFMRIHGDTREEALLRLAETFEDCVEALLEAGEEIPEPQLWPGANPVRTQQMDLGAASTQRSVIVSSGQRVVPATEDPHPWTVVPDGTETAGV